ncbi:MAG: glucokinase [Myxococcota bacterium]
MHLLAGDVGGTKCWLALYESRPDGSLAEIREARLPSADFASLGDLARAFLEGDDPELAGAAFGIAGPVNGRHVKVTNLPWDIDADELEAQLGVPHVALANDFVALARGLDALGPESLATLQDAPVDAKGPRVLIGAGTGLGQAVIVPTSEGPRILGSEGGHTDFAPRDAFEDALLAFLRERLKGRVSVERVVSGRGVHAIYDFVVATGRAPMNAARHAAIEAGDPGAEIGKGAAAGEPACVLAQDRFVAAYGAEAGNLGLKVIAPGGLYVAGGIAPKLLAHYGDEFAAHFMPPFLAKGRMRPVLERTRVQVVTEPKVGLLGARELAREAMGQP